MTIEHVKINCEICKKSVEIVKNDIHLCDECYWVERENEVEEYYSDRQDYNYMKDEYHNYFPNYNTVGGAN